MVAKKRYKRIIMPPQSIVLFVLFGYCLILSFFFVEGWEHLHLVHFFFHHGGLEMEFMLSNSVAIAFICWAISEVLELLLDDPLNFYIFIWQSNCTPLSRRLWFVDRAVMLGRRFSVLQLNWEQFIKDQYLLLQDWGKLGHALSQEDFVDTNYISLKSGSDVSVLKIGTINIVSINKILWAEANLLEFGITMLTSTYYFNFPSRLINFRSFYKTPVS